MQKFVVKKQRVDLQNKELINQYNDAKELKTVQEVNEDERDESSEKCAIRTPGVREQICKSCDKRTEIEPEFKSTTKLNTKMVGYLKKKRNKIGGYKEQFFCLQDNLLLSYNSKDDYEKKLASFKDVINLVPGYTIILPTLGPRFTIETNLKTLHTFRCDDNKTCSKWITAILDSLSTDYFGSRNKLISSKNKNYFSHENIQNIHRKQASPISQASRGSSHSWETLYTTRNLSRHDSMIGRLNQAILPIGPKTARILERGCYPESILIIEEPKKFMENPLHKCQKSQQNEIVEKDENHNDLPQSQGQHFRLHETNVQSQDVNRIQRIFKMELCSGESLKKGHQLSNSLSNIEEQVMYMSFAFEDESLIDDDEYLKKSVDVSRFNNGLIIEEFCQNPEPTKEDPIYAKINLKQKYENREIRQNRFLVKERPVLSINEYEDIPEMEHSRSEADAENIYELVELPLPTRSRSMIWRTWKRIKFDSIFDFRRIKESQSVSDIGRPFTAEKRSKSSFSKFNQSMRNKARKMCHLRPLQIKPETVCEAEETTETQEVS